MSKVRRNTWFVLLGGFMISELSLLILDVIMSTIQPEYGSHDTMRSFDLSLLSPFLYISCGTSLAISIGAMCKIIDAMSKTRIAGGVISRNNSTFIVSMSTIMFVVYGIGFVAAPDTIVGADTGYKIIKSSVEHFINPILLIIFYLSFSNNMVSGRDYAIKYGGYPLIYTTGYILFVIIREVMLVNFDPLYQGVPGAKPGVEVQGPNSYFNQNLILPAFPYASIDPYVKSPKIGIPAIIAFEIGIYAVCNFFNLLGNLTYKSMLKKQGGMFDIYLNNEYKNRNQKDRKIN